MADIPIPSIGDILMLSQLAWKIGRAFTAGRKGAPSEFLEVEAEVNALAKALKLLAETLFADAEDSLLEKADQDTQHSVAIILTSCQHTVSDLDSLMDRYQVIKKHRTAGGFAIERSWSDLVLTQYKAMMWTAEGGNIGNLRSKLQMHRSTITLTMQALQSKSLARLEGIVTPMAERIDGIRHRTGSLTTQLEEVHRIVVEIAGRTPQMPSINYQNSSPPSSFNLDMPQSTSLSFQSFPFHQNFPLRRSSKDVPIPAPQSPEPRIINFPPTPRATSPVSPIRNKRISEFSFGGSTSRYSDSRYSDSYASSDASSTIGRMSTSTVRNSYVSRQASTRTSILPYTPETREPRSRPDSGVLSTAPPSIMDYQEDRIERVVRMSTSSLVPPAASEYSHLHRSSTTNSQKSVFEKDAFRNAAILCDVRGSLVEYTHRVSLDDPHEVEMVTACTSCRIAIVRKREALPESRSLSLMTSVWVFSEDNTIRMQLKMEDGEVYLPYSSYFNPEKISLTVPCELRFHGVQWGERVEKSVKTDWVNYVFEDVKGATLFQNELMGRTLLATFPTSKTMRVHEGFSGAFSYAEQMCGMENLRIWEDDETGAVIAMIHFSAHFRNGYLAFYLNSRNSPIRVKDEGGREVKIKGLRVPLEKGSRKDSVMISGGSGSGSADGSGETGKEGKEGKKRSKEDLDRKKFIMGAKVEFESEMEKRQFLQLLREVQGSLMELPELLGVN